MCIRDRFSQCEDCSILSVSILAGNDQNSKWDSSAMIGMQITVRTTKFTTRAPKLIFILEPSMALPASVMKMIWLMESLSLIHIYQSRTYKLS